MLVISLTLLGGGCLNAIIFNSHWTFVQWCHVLPHLAEMECLLLQTTDNDSETETSNTQHVGNFHFCLFLTLVFLEVSCLKLVTVRLCC